MEKELGLRLKGENGIMKKKFSALQKDIEDQREEIRTMFAHKKELYQVCWCSPIPNLVDPRCTSGTPLSLTLTITPVYRFFSRC